MDSALRFDISLSGALGVISQVGDLSMGQPLGHSQRVARLAQMLARAMHGEGEHLMTAQQVALLRWSGCTANADGFAHLLGNDVDGRRAMLDQTLGAEQMNAVHQAAPLAVVHCEVSGQIAKTLELGAAVESGLCRIFETYDGTGRPFGVSHAHIPDAAYQVVLAGDLDILSRAHGLDTALSWISEQADRAGRVIKSVADFVRRREQVREAVAPASLIDAILPLLGLQAKKQGIRVQTQIAPGCPPVLCDRTMVEQVLLNLARNGVQAMPANDPTAASGLRVLTLAVSRTRLHASDDNEAAASGSPPRKVWVEFAVTDHGHGLSEAVRQQLFTPFFTTKAEGMGLGLSLCRTVIEQHGGALTHEPAQPRGTVFRFTLPAA